MNKEQFWKSLTEEKNCAWCIHSEDDRYETTGCYTCVKPDITEGQRYMIRQEMKRNNDIKPITATVAHWAAQSCKNFDFRETFDD